MTYVLYAFLFCITFFNIPCRLEAATVHAILVADFDNWDGEFRQGAKVDIKNFRLESRRIAEATGLDLKIYPFTGKKYNAQSLVNCIESLDVSPDDLILLFYSAHGIHTHSMGLEPLPILTFGPSSALYLRDVVNLIEKKKPRLSFILADCCHNWVADSLQPEMLQVYIKALPQPSIKKIQFEQYKNLFLKPSGTIILLAAMPGEFAYGTKSFGGYCTYYWTQTLSRLSKNLEPITWKTLLTETAQMVKGVSNTHPSQVSYNKKLQNPWFHINIDTEETYITPQTSFAPQWRKEPKNPLPEWKVDAELLNEEQEWVDIDLPLMHTPLDEQKSAPLET